MASPSVLPDAGNSLWLRGYVALEAKCCRSCTPLCPAGCLPSAMAPGVRHSGSQIVGFQPACGRPLLTPLKGGDQLSRRLSPIADVAGRAAWAKPQISPRVGEMPGKAEGGVTGWASVAVLPPGPRPCVILATPRFRSGLCLSWEAGRGRRTSLSKTWRVHRAPPVLSPRMGGPGSFRRSRLAPGGAGSGAVGPYRPDLHRGPDLWWVGSHQATLPLRDRPGHRHPPRHPGPEPGSRKGDAGIMREAAGEVDKSQRRKMRK